MPIFNSGCFCLSLTKGVIVAGSMSSVLATLFLVAYTRDLEHVYGSPTGPLDLWTVNSRSLRYVRFLLWIYLVVGLAFLLSSGLVVYGAISQRRRFLIPYLVLGAAEVVVLIFSIMEVVCSDDLDKIYQVPVLASVIVLYNYFLVCVVSLYRALLFEERNFRFENEESGRKPYFQSTQDAAA